MADTPGIDWIELILQVAVAAVGVTIAGSISAAAADQRSTIPIRSYPDQ